MPRLAALRPLLWVTAAAVGTGGAGLLLAGLLRQAAPARPGWRVLRPPEEVAALALHEGLVWAGGRDGVLALDRLTGAARPGLAPAFPMRHVSALLATADGTLWAAHHEGLSRRAGGTWTTVLRTGQEVAGRPLSLLPDGASLLVGTEGGLGRWSGSGFEPLAVPGDLAGASTDVLFRGGQGALWVGSASPTRGGLWTLEGGIWQRRDAEARLPHPSVNAVAETRDGSLWVATGFANRGGASRRVKGRWEAWTRREGLAGEKVRSVFEDRAGRLWFGSEYDGVAVLSGSRWLHLDTADGLAGREVKVVLEDPDGIFWLGTDGGLSRVERLE